MFISTSSVTKVLLSQHYEIFVYVSNIIDICIVCKFYHENYKIDDKLSLVQNLRNSVVASEKTLSVLYLYFDFE